MKNLTLYILPTILLVNFSLCFAMTKPTQDLFIAIRKNDNTAAQQAIAQRADINFRNDKTLGCTPLILASLYLQHDDIVSTLVDNGSDPNMQDYNGHTALYKTAMLRNEKSTNNLLRALQLKSQTVATTLAQLKRDHIENKCTDIIQTWLLHHDKLQQKH